MTTIAMTPKQQAVSSKDAMDRIPTVSAQRQLTYLADLYSIAPRALPYMPPRLGYTLCDVLGAVLGPRLPAWPCILDNLRVLMPTANEAERAAAARRVMIGMFKNYFDLFRFHALSAAALERTLVAEGLAHIEQALAQRQGVLLAAPHCGPYTIVFAPFIRHFATRALLVVEQLADPRIHQLMNRVRQVPGIDVESLSPTIGRSILRALRQNHIVVLGGDRALAAHALTVDFFGRPTPLPSGPATLALRTGAPLLTGIAQRLPDNRFLARIDPPLLVQRSASLQQDIYDVTQKIAYSMQAYICRDPAQWLVAERVWPTA